MKQQIRNGMISLLTLGAILSPVFADHALRHRNLQVPLSKCAADCMTMPLIVGFQDSCDTACESGVMKQAGIEKPNFRQLAGVGMIFVDEISDSELELLRGDENVAFIECDSCIVGLEKPICGSNNVTYTNVEELNCGLKCRGSDSSISVAYQGSCTAGSALQSVDELTLSNCDDNCMTMPLMIGFADNCDIGCEIETMQRANIDKTNFDQTSLGIIFLKEVTDEQLTALRSESGAIDFIECNSCISTTTVEPVCSSKNITYQNEAEFNCGLQCRGSDTSTTISHKGACGSAVQSVVQSVDELPLNNCADGCMTMPLIITFLEDCDIVCAAEVMKGASVDKTNYDHLTSSNIILLQEVTDDQLTALRRVTGTINVIECDSCVSGATVEPVCSSNNITYQNEQEFSCGLKCRDSDTSVTVAYQGVCGSAIQSVDEVPLGNCDADCMIMPLILTFVDNCDITCAAETMQLSGVEKSSYQHLAALNIILLGEVTDDQLVTLRSASRNINSIECDSCSVGIEDSQMCGSDSVTYKNGDELNCGLQCRDADSTVTMAYHGACQESSAIVPLTQCTDGCMTMPLMVGFKPTCDTDCAIATLQAANIDKEKFDHLIMSNIIVLNEVTDEELTALQSKSDFINFIECDTCVSIGEVAQVCGTDGVTYKNEGELSCGLKCRGADKTMTIASQGVCSQSGVAELVSLTCDQDCMRMPLLIGFEEDCDDTCALETMRRANIPKIDFDHLAALNIIMLNSVTDEQLMVLRGENGYISFIECDACVNAIDDLPVCASNGLTFRNTEQLTCENQCRETSEEISIAYRGPCEAKPTLAPSGGGGIGIGICFSSVNQVQLSNGETKKIDQLQLGDEVLTQMGYENIYSWSHRNSEKEAEFVQLFPSRIELSPNHLIFLENGVSVPGGTVKAGDILLSGEMVTAVRSVTRRGVYAPFTNSGTIVVNGQVASTFVSLQEKSSVLLLNGGWSTGISHQWLAHAFEVPHRLWCSAVGCTKESYTSDGISTWVAAPLQFFNWSLQLPTILQLILFVPILSLFGVLFTLELAVKNYLVTAGLLGILIHFGGLSSRFQVRKYSKTA